MPFPHTSLAALQRECDTTQNPQRTYFLRVGTEKDEIHIDNVYLGVRTGDILTVDRAQIPAIGNLLLVVCDESFVLCRLIEHEGKRFFVCGHKNNTPVEVTPQSNLHVWGVVSGLSRGL